MEQDLRKFAPLALMTLIASLAAYGIVRLLTQRRRPRSFREDPIGAIKDHSELFAERAQDATEETIARMQESLDELRSRLPEINRRKVDKRRAELNGRLSVLNDQIQSMMQDVRNSNVFNR